MGLAALTVCLGQTEAWAGHGSSGGSHGSSGGSRGGFFSHGSLGGLKARFHSHGSSGGSSGGYRSNGNGTTNGAPNGTKAEETTTPAQGASLTRRDAVLLTIVVPADAKLFIENQPTQLTGTRRQFISPRLEIGKEYIYTLKAEVETSGQTLSGTEEVPVKAGDHKTVEFGPSAENPSLLVAGRR